VHVFDDSSASVYCRVDGVAGRIGRVVILLESSESGGDDAVNRVGPDSETRVRATSPMRPTVPPPYTSLVFALWRACASDLAASMWTDDVPLEAPQNTATTGWLVEPLLAVASSFAMSIAWMMSVRNEKASIGTRAVSSN